MPLAAVNKGTFIYLQALGRVREIIFGTMLPVILPEFFGLAVISCSMPAADILTFIISVIVIISVFRRLSEPQGCRAAVQRLICPK